MNILVKHNPQYNYGKIQRKETDQGRRYQTPSGDIVPSVTTILDKSKGPDGPFTSFR